MVLGLIFTAIILAAVSAASVLSLMNARMKLSHYRQLQDAEAYKAQCESHAQQALQKREEFVRASEKLKEHISAQKARVSQYQHLLGKLHTAAELEQRIKHDEERAKATAARLRRVEHAVKLEKYIDDQESVIAKNRNEIESLSAAIGSARTVSEIAAQAKYFENYIAQLKADVEAIEETKSLQEFGFYRPRYNFESVEAFQTHIDEVRARQKAMLSNKKACISNTEWTVDGDKAEGRRMVNQQIKLMLRAFNGECDAAVSKVRYNNAVSLENRIRRSFEQINKLGEAKRIYLSGDFCNLKLDELRLAHEFQEKKEEERETQRQIRDQMREEQKVRKEIEKACASAEREEVLKKHALEQARSELEKTAGEQTAKLEALVSRLESELKDALDRKAKAIARAQLTKSGHVYILSNIGAFGEGVYKIGMSRRLEPLDRVYELGGASVPFPFDVHAMIYSENAPELECSLHRHFASRRVNMINLRREFFRVTLEEIRAAVGQYFGHVTFVLDPEAAQYRQTLALEKDSQSDAGMLQIA